MTESDSESDETFDLMVENIKRLHKRLESMEKQLPKTNETKNACQCN